MSLKRTKLLLAALALTCAMVLMPIQSAMAATLSNVITGGEAGVAPGYSAQMSVAVSGEDGEDTSVSWTVTGNSSPATAISSRGSLTIGIDEKASYVTVVAVLNVDPAQIATTTVAINYPQAPVQGPEITSVSMSSVGSVEAGSQVTLSAKVNGTGDYDTGIIWSLSGNTSASTYINNAGILTVGADEKGPIVTVTAIAKGDSKKTASVNVTIVPMPDPDPVVTAVSVSGSSYVKAGQSAEYRSRVRGEHDYDSSVTWSVTGATSTKTVISSTGLLTVGSDEKSTSITVVATSNNTPSVSGTMTVSIGVIQVKEDNNSPAEEASAQRIESKTDFTGKDVTSTTTSTTVKGDSVKQETRTNTTKPTTNTNTQNNTNNSTNTSTNTNNTSTNNQVPSTPTTTPVEEKPTTPAVDVQKELDRVKEDIRQVLSSAAKNEQERQEQAQQEEGNKPATTENAAQNGAAETSDNSVAVCSFAGLGLFTTLLFMLSQKKKEATSQK